MYVFLSQSAAALAQAEQSGREIAQLRSKCEIHTYQFKIAHAEACQCVLYMYIHVHVVVYFSYKQLAPTTMLLSNFQQMY